MIDLSSATEVCDGYQVRAWSGVATDEGVGMICLVEVSSGRGRVSCRFEAMLAASVQRGNPDWSGPDAEVAVRLQDNALARAREAILGNGLADLHGRRLDIG
ncbi:MAG TPA: hypothetical protein VG845_01615 [Dehalococcoidia bacterium]|nr:hypothetical protein [Dehalococcoidia bacterium]